MKRLLFVLLAMGASAVSAETIAYWRFGDQGLEDCSGHNIELVNTNVELDSTGAAVFNGTDSSLETKESLDLTAYNKLTIECWFKPEYPAEASTDFMPLFLHCLWDSTNGNAPGSIVTYFSGNENGLKTFRSQLRDGDWSGGWTYTRVNGTADNYPMMDGAWHHVALVMDLTATWSDKSKLYIDGVRMPGTESMSAAAISSFSSFKFILGGGGTYVPGDFFHGAIDDVRISTGALEPSQFLKFPTVGRHQSPENPAVAYWPFGSKELTDVTGNGFDFQPADPATIGFGNDSIQIGGKGLVSAAAIPAQAFTHSGLTYECFVQTTSTVDLSVLLEISPVYYNLVGL